MHKAFVIVIVATSIVSEIVRTHQVIRQKRGHSVAQRKATWKRELFGFEMLQQIDSVSQSRRGVVHLCSRCNSKNQKVGFRKTAHFVFT